jgi:hypothetical protein
MTGQPLFPTIQYYDEVSHCLANIILVLKVWWLYYIMLADSAEYTVFVLFEYVCL